MLEKKWYERQDGRWHQSIENALAGNDSVAKGIAWAILVSVGGGHRCQTEFGKMVGVPQNQISNYLAGRRQCPPKVIDRVSEIVSKELSAPYLRFCGLLYHPLELGTLGGWLVPGDHEYDAWYAIVRKISPSNPPLAELKARFPNFFPLE